MLKIAAIVRELDETAAAAWYPLNKAILGERSTLDSSASRGRARIRLD
jgi:hypothetical protein